MRENVARLQPVFPCVALALLLAACTTTTTLVTSDGSRPAAVAARGEASTRQTTSMRYVVQRGDTLYAIAFRNRVDLRELIAWNDLAEPYTIYPGQALRIERDIPVAHTAQPPSRASAPTRVAVQGQEQAIAVAPGPAIPAPAAPSEPMRVARGQVVEPPTPVESIPAARPGTPAAGMTAQPMNGDAGAAQRAAESPQLAGPALRATTTPPPPPVASMPAIPIAEDEGVHAAVVDAGPVAGTAPGTAASVPVAPVAPVAIRTVPVAPPLPETPAEFERDVGPIRASPTRMAGGIGWRWPTSATLVGRYAADDEARQGIRLQGPAGTPVTAAADGEVVYSGNGLVGLGELVIIKHGAEYLSAYGLNRKRLVTEGQKVKAGQLVAEMGNSAGVAGLLHFEVRRGGRPIDPLSVLPPR